MEEAVNAVHNPLHWTYALSRPATPVPLGCVYHANPLVTGAIEEHVAELLREVLPGGVQVRAVMLSDCL
jgi:hypothetical protein